MDPMKTTDASGGGEIKLPLYSITAESLLRDAWPMFGGDIRDVGYWAAFSDATNFAVGHIAAALASAPPAPTPDAGSDLAKLSAGATQGQWTHRPWTTGNGHVVEEERELITVGEAEYFAESLSVEDANFIVALVQAFRSGRLVEASASPHPAEDLAGQGEPVADLWQWIDGRRACAQGYLDLCERNRTDNPYQRGRMSLLTELARFLKAAPAPSRPADRAEANRLFEAIKDALYAADVLYGHPAHARLRELRALALRDTPRDAGDGWSTDMEAAPKDGSLILLHGKLKGSPQAGWYIGKWWQGGSEGFWAAHSVEVCPTCWASLPPSPTPTDRTQDMDKGGDHA